MTHCRTSVVGLLLVSLFNAAADTESRPYEFSFNIEDFQHRYEKRDSAGIITGEYGFITADGVYHETAYATDENGNFLITKMKNRKITSLKVAQEIFKGKPEVAKRVIEVLAKSCSGCGIPVNKAPEIKYSDSGVAGPQIEHGKKRLFSLMKNEQSTPAQNINNEQEPRTASEASKASIINAVGNPPDPETPQLDNEIVRSTPNDYHYHFNYKMASHGHEETGYRDGTKDGSYQTLGLNGTDAKVEYLSNEFGHQPNITFVNRQDAPDIKESFAGFVFKWIYERR